jgi:diguanylate cyclase (GGDEF)-like protein
MPDLKFPTPRQEALRIALPPLVAIILFVAVVFGLLLPGYHTALLERKKEMIRELTTTAWNILYYYNARVDRGELTREEAQATAVEELRKLRYGPENKDYFWINDMGPVLIMHPYRPDLEGHDVSDFADTNGNLVFMSFVDKVRQEGSGFVPYLWQWKDDPGHIVPKLSYIKGFQPWGWIIGTGIYLNDVEQEIAQVTNKMVMVSLAILLCIAALSAHSIGQGIRAGRQRREAVELLRQHHDQLAEDVNERTREVRESNELLRSEVEEHARAEKRITGQNLFLESIIESLPFPFYVVDTTNYMIQMANSAAMGEGWQGGTCHLLTHASPSPCGGSDHICPLDEVKKTGKSVTVEHRHCDHKGVCRYYEVHGFPIFDEEGRVVRMIEISLDITRRKELEAQLLEISNTDQLTGLYNRRGFFIMAEKQMQVAQRQGIWLTLLFIDLDNFKQINDTLGHESGDITLKVAATVMKDTFRQSDIIGRLGGDEFAALLVEDSGKPDDVTVQKRLQKNLDHWNQPLTADFPLEMSCGTAHFDPAHPRNLDELFAEADRCMYQAKQGKKAAKSPKHAESGLEQETDLPITDQEK